jgi:peptidyl-prolyl cis-trans isomerase SurA
MSFRNRPVLDRKHRPRWQDELRSQQLIVAGFALAIAVAVGIFAAVAWSSFYNDNLRQVALVQGRSVDRADLSKRADLVAAELGARYLELQRQLGGMRDQILQQQISSLEQAINSVDEIASDSLVTGLVLDAHAGEFGLSVEPSTLDAEVQERRTLPAGMRLSLIMVQPELDEDAEEDAEPTDQDWADARAEIDDVKQQLDGGAEWETLVTEHSDHASSQVGGRLGWLSEDDAAGMGEFLEAAADAAVGDVVGPLRNEEGWYLLRVDEREQERPNQDLADFLTAAGISEEEYRGYVRQDLLQSAFRDYFVEEVVGAFAPQRNVAQIQIAADQGAAGAPDPKIQIRHLLAKPLPDEQDQSEATDEQWAAAQQRAEEMRRAAMEDDADWYKLARDSDDTGTRTRGGSLGWHDPASLETQFVPEFAEAARELDVGEISEPVRSEFGYHIIQVTDRRVSALELAERLAADIQEDPDRFEQLARDYSEDPVTASKGGDLGWVIPYQFEAARQDAIFGLAEVGDTVGPVEASDGLYLFKLLGVSESRFVSEEKRDQVSSGGFSRWLVELEEESGVWVDPELAPVTTEPGGGGTTPIVP